MDKDEFLDYDRRREIVEHLEQDSVSLVNMAFHDLVLCRIRHSIQIKPYDFISHIRPLATVLPYP